MWEKFKSSILIILLGLVTMGLLFFWILVSWPLLLKLLFCLSLYILVVAVAKPEVGFLLFLFFRPALDFSSNDRFISFFSWNLNFSSFYGLLFLVAVLIFLLSHLDRLKIKLDYPLLLTWLVFLAFSLVSLIWSFNAAASLVELARLGTFFAAFILGAILIRRGRDLTRLIKVIIFSALIPGVVALYQLLTNSGLAEDGTNRLFGTFGHPNMLAFFLCLIITLSFFIFLNIKKNRLEAYFYLLLGLLFFFILLFTYTRGAYLLIAAVLVMVGFLKFRKFLIAASIVALIVYLAIPSFQTRLNSLFKADPYSSISWRINLWHDEISYIKQKPIAGYGSGLAEQVIATNRDFRLGATEPHNDFLRTALDLGLVGLALYLILIARSLWLLGRNYFQTEAPRLRVLNLFVLAFSVSLFALSAGDNILKDTALNWCYWFLIGGSLSLQLKNRQKKPADL